MLKAIAKLALAAFIANAAWRMGSAYLADFNFRDGVRAAAAFEAKTDVDLRQRILAMASRFDLPMHDDAFTIARQESRVFVDGSYVKPIELFPGYEYPWHFSWTVDVQVVAAKPGELNELMNGQSPDKL